MTCSASDQVGLQQGLGGALHRYARKPAHLAELVRECSQLLVVSGTHGPSLRSAQAEIVTTSTVNER